MQLQSVDKASVFIETVGIHFGSIAKVNFFQCTKKEKMILKKAVDWYCTLACSSAKEQTINKEADSWAWASVTGDRVSGLKSFLMSNGNSINLNN